MPTDEALWVSGVSLGEYALPLSDDLRAEPVVDRGRCHQADARVAMLMVVVLEEDVAEGLRIFEAAEAVREFRPVLEGLELRFREGVVVGNVRS